MSSNNNNNNNRSRKNNENDDEEDNKDRTKNIEENNKEKNNHELDTCISTTSSESPTFSNLWFETDTTHPSLLKQWLSKYDDNQQNISTHTIPTPPDSVKFHSSYLDVFGNDRFCSFQVLSTKR
mmetsp:Transcript_39018/g.50450  ORF Transcript_39018/g.50450 Transcript_39018/m.50450 type:complete len:124 (-) Transcript_39018:202-573(-)